MSAHYLAAWGGLVLALALLLTACGDAYRAQYYDQSLDDTVARNLTRGATVTYTVQGGETLTRVAKAFSVSPRAIIEANGLEPPYHLLTGQKLVIPRPAVHEVIRGDTLYSIARRYNVAQRDLVALNDLSKPYRLIPGLELRLPQPDGRAAAGEAAGHQAGRSPGNQVAQAPPVPAQKPAAPPQAGTEPARNRSNDTGRSPDNAGDRSRAPAPEPEIRFVRPVTGEVIAGFGRQGNDQKNDGINIAAPQGTPVRASASGTVVYADSELEAFGNLVLIRHAGNWVTAYAHLATIQVERGQEVAQLDQVGTVGRTGQAQRPQLHFELRRGTEAVDPRPHLVEPSTDAVAWR